MVVTGKLRDKYLLLINHWSGLGCTKCTGWPINNRHLKTWEYTKLGAFTLTFRIIIFCSFFPGLLPYLGGYVCINFWMITLACNKTHRFNINNYKISSGLFIFSDTKIVKKYGLEELKYSSHYTFTNLQFFHIRKYL